jgi:hypothetical protein
MLADLEREIKENEERGNDLSKFYKFSKTGYTYLDYNEELCKLTSMEVDTKNYDGKP